MEVKRLADGSETWDAATGKCSSCEIKYLAINVTQKQAAIRAVLADAPRIYDALTLKEVRVESYEKATMELSAVYTSTEDSESSSGGGSVNSQDEDAPTVNFDCGACVMHITEAIKQTCVYAAEGETKETDKEAAAVPIGWNGKTGSESEAAGIDIKIGEIRQTFTKTLSFSKVMSTSWMRKIARLVGKVNSSSFKGWDEGEIMFLGCSYSTPTKGTNKVNVGFQFAVQLNEDESVVAGQEIAGGKKGFEAFWVISEDEVKDGRRVRKVKKIYKAEVCKTDGFGSLGL